MKRLALLLVACALLAAIGWFFARHHAPESKALEAPTQTKSVRTERGASPIETRPAADTRSIPIASPGTDEVQVRYDALAASPRSGLDDALGLHVRVLDPTGEPLPGAVLSSVWGGNASFNVEVPRPTDFTGSRMYHLRAGSLLDLRASDPEGRYGPAYAFDVGPEQRKLDLDLEPSTPRTLVVMEEGGTAIERFAWRLLDQRQYVSHRTGKIPLDENGRLMDTMFERLGTGSFSPAETEQQAHPGGRVELHIGSLEFAIQVEATDFEQAQVGPFAAADAPGEIRVVLQRLPGIRGRVVHAGKGVPGAWVKLLRPLRNGRTFYINGFPSSCEAWAAADARTDDDGWFALQLRRTGEYLIRAGATDLSVAELGPRRFEAHQGAEGLELVLPAAGAIDGRILLAEAEPLREWIIGASRGDGMARSVHTDPDGRFRFESLTPGEWLLRPTETDLDPDMIHSISDGGELDRPPPATCVVRAGESTQVVFDLRIRPVLIGKCDLPGWEKAQCSGSLDAIGGAFSRIARFEPNPPGSLRAEVDQPGEYQLVISWHDKDRGHSLALSDRVRLERGENAWTFEHPVGELVLANALEVEQVATLRCELGEARRASISAKLSAHEECKIAGVPVGKWVLLRRDEGAAREEASVEIIATEPARMELR